MDNVAGADDDGADIADSVEVGKHVEDGKAVESSAAGKEKKDVDARRDRDGMGTRGRMEAGDGIGLVGAVTKEVVVAADGSNGGALVELILGVLGRGRMDGTEVTGKMVEATEVKRILDDGEGDGEVDGEDGEKATEVEDEDTASGERDEGDSSSLTRVGKVTESCKTS
ncbi:hypothetical protein HDU97_006747 [Phlyctochytrium planicorne]|nr:hypothetical protein HDU97_006747 [Phlyctochytrium planicorne]